MTEPITRCPKCSAALINVFSGAMCPLGCGGIFEKVSPEDHAKAVAEGKRATLPLAQSLQTLRAADAVGLWCSTTLYRIVCPRAEVKLERGIYRRVPRQSNGLSEKKIAPGDVLAYDPSEDQVVQLRLYAAGDAEVRSLYALAGLEGIAKAAEDEKLSACFAVDSSPKGKVIEEALAKANAEEEALLVGRPLDSDDETPLEDALAIADQETA